MLHEMNMHHKYETCRTSAQSQRDRHRLETIDHITLIAVANVTVHSGGVDVVVADL